MVPLCNAEFTACGAFLACAELEGLLPLEAFLQEGAALKLVVRLWDVRNGSLKQVQQVDLAPDLGQGASGIAHL